MSRRRIRSHRPSSNPKHRSHDNHPARRKMTGNLALAICAVLLVFFAIASNARKHKASAAQPETDQIAQDDASLPNQDAREGAILVDTERVSLELEEIILTIPHSEMREMIHKHIGTGQIGLDWVDLGTEAAFLLDGPFPGHRVPVINFSPTFTTKARRDTHALVRAQLVVYHEFIHFLQWRDEGYPEETFVLKSATHDRDACTKKWYAEKDAYHRECEFAQETGLLEQLDPNEGLRVICTAASEESTFSERLRTILPRGDTSAAACAVYWRDLR